MVGAVALSVMPVCFLVIFGYGVMNRNLTTWFRAPANNDLQAFENVADLFDKEMSDETVAQAELLAAKAETRDALLGHALPADFLESFGKDHELRSAAIFLPGSPKSPRLPGVPGQKSRARPERIG